MQRPHIQLFFSIPEPLYQEYRAKAINKQIQESGGSVGSGDYEEPADLKSSLRPKRGPTQSFLWQELPSVRNSGVLPQLSPAECRRQEVRALCEGEEERK